MDADHPSNGVLFPRRITAASRVSLQRLQQNPRDRPFMLPRLPVDLGTSGKERMRFAADSLPDSQGATDHWR